MPSFTGEVFERAAIRAHFRCEACGRRLPKSKPKDVADYEIHSATSLHLVGGPERYQVTDPPIGFDILRGRFLSGRLFRVSYLGFRDDAFCLCPTCHRDIHTEATTKTKVIIPGYRGRVAIPSILEEVTLDFIYRTKK